MTDMATDFNRYDVVQKTAPPAGTTGRSAVSLSSFGGEGQGEEASVLRQPVRHIGSPTGWKVARPQYHQW